MNKEWNIKPRLVRCRYCKIDEIRDDPNPKCATCGHEMITVIPELEKKNGES